MEFEPESGRTKPPKGSNYHVPQRFPIHLAASTALGAVLAGLAIAPSAGASGAGSRAGWVTSVTATGLIKLVSPTGEQVTLTSRGAGYEIADVSTDGNRIVLLNTKTNTIAYYDAATKKRSTFSVAGFDGLGREEVRHEQLRAVEEPEQDQQLRPQRAGGLSGRGQGLRRGLWLLQRAQEELRPGRLRRRLIL